MIALAARPPIDSRDVHAVARDALVRRSGYVPDWLGARVEDDPSRLPRSPDAAFVWILARYIETILRRLDQAPEKNELAFLESLGIELIPAQSGRAPVVFRTAPDSANAGLRAGTRLMAPPPPESTDQVAFETETACGVAGAQLVEVFSLWPGRDQYIDHSAAATVPEDFHPFRLSELEDTPHHLYIAHERLLNLDGEAIVEVEFELVRPSDETLDIEWQYWDGEVWRGFRAAHPLCGEDQRTDGTVGLTRNGVVRVESACAETSPTTVNGIESSWIRGCLRERLLPGFPQHPPEVAGVRLSTRLERPIGAAAGEVHLGLLPDSAMVAGATIDTTEPFYPFGQQPAPGSTFYFAADEVFSRPGAVVTISVTTAEPPQNKVDVAADDSAGERLTHQISWEYWDGSEWRPLFALHTNTPPETSPKDFTSNGTVELIVPDAIRKTEVGGEEAYWVRVRVLDGGFGFTQLVKWKDTSGVGDAIVNTFTYVITQAPALRDFRIGFTWADGPYEPEHVVNYNDFQYEDVTDEAKWEGDSFKPFSPIRDITPALYFGFDKRLPVDRLNFFFDIQEQLARPELVWEYWSGSSWSRLGVDDGTNRLAVTGMLSFIGPGDSRPYARFGQPLHWVRAALKEDGPPGSTTVRQFYHNAVWAVQRDTIINDPLGASNGLPNQLFLFPQIPVLAGEAIEVREVDGERANVEWRIVATELFDGDLRQVRELEERISDEGPSVDVEAGPLRLRRDRERRVVEVWVRWEHRRHLYHSAPESRHYTLERARGRLRFGDGQHGRIPPDGAAILARRYRTGGGRRGNVPERAITQAAAGLGSVEDLFNPLPGEGGAEAETLARVSTRGPRTVRHRDRAVSGPDYETMAKEASAAIAIARAMPTREPGGRQRPGWVTLLIIPESSERRPWPSWQLREQVRRYIGDRAGADIVAARRIYVTGPTYFEVDVRAELVPVDLDAADSTEAAARRAVEDFLHPLRGGPDGAGWEMGRDVYLSDLSAVLERADGVDFVRDLALLSGAVPQGERLRVPDGRVVAAGNIQIILRS